MARGGVIQPAVALDRLFKAVGSRKKAEDRVVDALVSGSVTAKGRPVTGYLEELLEPGQLRDLAAYFPEPVLGALIDIPHAYWRDLSVRDVESWNWVVSSFHNSSRQGLRCKGYREVVFNERQINSLIKQLSPSDAPAVRTPKERRRQPEWNDWIAAVAILGHEQQIHGGMKRQDLLDRINSKLAAWGLNERPESTVGPAASAILQRYQSHPPMAPLTVDAKPQ